MFDSIIVYLNTWNARKTERQKLQGAYLVATIIIVLLSGVLSLINNRLGHILLKVALLAVATFLVNAVSWGILQSSVIDKLASKPKRK